MTLTSDLLSNVLFVLLAFKASHLLFLTKAVKVKTASKWYILIFDVFGA